MYSNLLSRRFSDLDKARQSKGDPKSTVSDSAVPKISPIKKVRQSKVASLSEKGVKTVSDSGVVIQHITDSGRRPITHPQPTIDDDDDVQSISTLDDVSSITSVRSGQRDVIERDPKSMVPALNLANTNNPAWKKPSILREAKQEDSVVNDCKKKGKVAVVRCIPVKLNMNETQVKSEKLGIVNPSTTFLPIEPHPVTPRTNDNVTVPKIVSKIVLETKTPEKPADRSEQESLKSSLKTTTKLEPSEKLLSSLQSTTSVKERVRRLQATAELKVAKPKLSGDPVTERARLILLANHEDHIADMNTLCKQEMDLLTKVKNGDLQFEAYMAETIDNILTKLRGIELLRDQFLHHSKATK